MSNFQAIGVTATTSRMTETVEVMGQKTTTEFLVTTLTLPTPSKVQGSFSREGIVNKIVKLFKKEIQVGDKAFDDLVYISTDTPEATTAFLNAPGIQNTLMVAASAGGSFEIEGTRVVAKYPYSGTNEDEDVFNFVRALLAV